MLAKLFTLLSLLLLAGCSSVPSLLYRIDVQQGNFITQEIVDKLNLGMTKSQVRFVLGSALISDPFHDNRWDYVYRLVQDGKLTEQRRLTVFFENDKLIRTEGDTLPSFVSVSPALIKSDGLITEKKEATTLSPETTALSPQQNPKTLKSTSDVTPKLVVPTKSSTEEKYVAKVPLESATSSRERPPPPGISDGIEAD
ncbi:MAG: outer membrane protein assembly factor BamE [Nitrosomonadaceae bacterium]|nr:outer membrane protein assembly factor BamE [Nitrosomonadaceae bacterium]MDW7652898.1 outer membrane protein assembly factor BamE [Nitrosomonadaceae bacterium]MDW7664102.1 outer membrane protein assembly factor BamE [Nitrosomonadaceae bacterium]